MNKYAKHIVDNISQMIDGINSNVTQACRIQVNKFLVGNQYLFIIYEGNANN